MTQQRVAKPVEKREEEPVEELPQGKESDTKKITDDLLDEIDDLLETNAESFVTSYVQRGGE